MSIYQSTFLTPINVAIDASVDNDFTCIVQGSIITSYIIEAFDNSDDSLDYTDTVNISGSPLYNGETLTHEVLVGTGLVNDKEYRWRITTSDGVDSAISSFAVFRTNTPATAVFNPAVPATIVAQSYLFEVTYTQTENVSIGYTQFIFYDTNDDIILETEKSYNTGRIEYLFEGFLDGSDYSVELIGSTANNVPFTSGIESFTVDYSSPSITLSPLIVEEYLNDCYKSSLINISWGDVIQLIGQGTGSYSFVDNCNSFGSKSLKLPSPTDYVTFTKDFSDLYTFIFEWKPSSFSSGIISKFIGASQYDVGYDGTRFYVVADGNTYTSSPIGFIYSTPGSLFPSNILYPSNTLYPTGENIDKNFLFGLTENGIYIRSDADGTEVDNIFIDIPDLVLGLFTDTEIYGGDVCFDNVRMLSVENSQSEFDNIVIGEEQLWTPDVVYNATFEDSTLNAGNIEGATSPLEYYDIYRRESTDVTLTKLATVPFDSTEYIDTTAKPNTDYIYSLVAKNDTEIAQPIEGNFTTDWFGDYLINPITYETYLFNVENDFSGMSTETAYQRHDGYNKYSSYSFGERDFRTGSVSGIPNSDIQTNGIVQSVDFVEQLQNFIADGEEKIYKTKKGEVLKVHTFNFDSNPFINNSREQLYRIGFDFEEIGGVD